MTRPLLVWFNKAHVRVARDDRLALAESSPASRAPAQVVVDAAAYAAPFNRAGPTFWP